MRGLSPLITVSTLACETPISSASIIAISVQRTISNHRSSPWRTAGPSGSFEMISGKMMLSSGCASLARKPKSAEASVVTAPHLPAA